jgi:hypothetical protein
VRQTVGNWRFRNAIRVPLAQLALRIAKGNLSSVFFEEAWGMHSMEGARSVRSGAQALRMAHIEFWRFSGLL